MNKSNYKRILSVVILGLVATYAYAEVIKPSFTTDAMKANSVATDSLTNKSGSGSPNFPFGATGITADSPNEMTNLIDNQNGVTGLINAQPNQVQDWIDTGVGMVSSVTTTTSEIALYPSELTGIKLTLAAGTNDYTQVRFTMPPALHNYKLALDWVQKVSGYSASGAKVEVWRNAAADYSGAYSEIALSADDSSGDSFIPNSTGLYSGNTFDTDNSSYYELRFVNAGGSAGYVSINEISVGYRRAAAGAIVTEWEDYTPSISALAGTAPTLATVHNKSAMWRRVGSSLEINWAYNHASATGAANGSTTAYTFNIPPGLTIDATRLEAAVSERNTLGNGYLSFGSNRFEISVDYATSTSLGLLTDNLAWIDSSNKQLTGSANYKLSFRAAVPIAEWAGSGTLNMGTNDVEYAYNTDVSATATVLASGFAYGSSGVSFPSSNWTVGTRWERGVRFQSKIHPTDIITLEWNIYEDTWQPMSESFFSYIRQSTNEYGATSQGISGSTTDVSVRFTKGGYFPGSTYGADGPDWTGLSAYKWRVKKTKAGRAVGFGLATSTESGLVKKTQIISNQNTSGIPNGTYTQAGSGSITLPAGNYRASISLQLLCNYSVAPTVVSGVLRLFDGTSAYGQTLSSGLAKYSTTSSRVNIAGNSEFTLTSEKTIYVQGYISTIGGTITTRDLSYGTFMVTKID